MEVEVTEPEEGMVVRRRAAGPDHLVLRVDREDGQIVRVRLRGVASGRERTVCLDDFRAYVQAVEAPS